MKKREKKVIALLFSMLLIVILLLIVIIMVLLSRDKVKTVENQNQGKNVTEVVSSAGVKEKIVTPTAIPVQPPVEEPSESVSKEKISEENQALLAYHILLTQNEGYLDDKIIYNNPKNVKFFIENINADSVPELVICETEKGKKDSIYVICYVNNKARILYHCKNAKITIYPKTGIFRILKGGKELYYQWNENSPQCVATKSKKKYKVEKKSVKPNEFNAYIVSFIGDTKGKQKYLNLSTKNIKKYLGNQQYQKVSTIINDVTEWVTYQLVYNKKIKANKKWKKIVLSKKVKKEIVSYAANFYRDPYMDISKKKKLSKRIFGENISDKYETIVGEWGDETWETALKKLSVVDENTIKLTFELLGSYSDIKDNHIYHSGDCMIELKRKDINSAFYLKGISLKK